jgi:hypothetical protein
MSKWENWIESQQRTVEADGVQAATIKLEAPDGQTWGTWSAKEPELAETIATTIELMVDDLPKERHACRLVSYDAKGEQLSVMPHAVQGRSAEAGKTSNTAKAHAQATAVALGNAEQVLGIQSRQLERLNHASTDLVEDNLVLRQKLIEITTATLADRTQERLAEERMALFKELATTAKPLIEAVIAMAAEFGQIKYSDWLKNQEKRQLAAETESTKLARDKAELEQQKAELERQNAELKAEQQKAELERQNAELKAEQERTKQDAQGNHHQPTNGAARDRNHQAARAPSNGRAGRQANHRDRARKSRAKSPSKSRHQEK